MAERTAGGTWAPRRRPVAFFVRSDNYRTAGTDAMTAGNGGRLFVDLGDWLPTEEDAEQFQVLIVASCIFMLKEMRRRRIQYHIMAGGASGGGP